MTLRVRTLMLVTGLLVTAVVATSAVLAWTSNAALLAQTEADGVLIANLLARTVEFADDIENDVGDMVNGQMVVEATLAAQLVALGEAHGASTEEITARLRQVTRQTALDEIWVTDETGHAYIHTVPNVDFTFSPDSRERPQASAFWPLLGGSRSRVIQKAQARELDGKRFEYVGVRGVDRPRIVQVGYNAEYLDRLSDRVGLSRLTQDLVAGGNVAALQVVDPNLVVLAYSALPGREAGQRLSAEDALRVERAIQYGETASDLANDVLTVIAPIADSATGRRTGAAIVQLSAQRILDAQQRQLELTGLVAATILCLGVIVSTILARRVTRPVGQLTAAAAAIEAGTFEPAMLGSAAARRDELGSLARQFRSMVVALEEAGREQIKAEVVRHDLDRARGIQDRLLPDPERLAHWPGLLDLAVRFRPAREMSGDFYDVLELAVPTADAASSAPAPLQIAVGDVAGKSIPAALVMALARTTLRAVVQRSLESRAQRASESRADPPDTGVDENGDTAAGPPPATTMRLTGRVLNSDVGGRDFVACALAVVEPPVPGRDTPRLHLVNAGQAPPILCRAGRANELDPPGDHLPLGILPDPAYEELVVDLQPGDVVVFTSDGLAEAPAAATRHPLDSGRPASGPRDPAAGGGRLAAAVMTIAPDDTAGPAAERHLTPPAEPGEMFGFERLAASAAYWSTHAADADGIAAGIWDDVNAWSDNSSEHDDMTLLVLRVHGG